MNQAVLVYDGNCLLCSKSVQLVLKHDTAKHILFTTFSSAYSKKRNLSAKTVVVITPNENVLIKHNAVRYVIENLPKYRWLRFLFIITPLILQKGIYILVAKNRRHFFGTYSCMLSKQFEERFIS